MDPLPELPGVELAGLRFARVTRAQAVDRVAEALRRGQGGWLLTATLDYVRRFAQDPAARELFRRADLVVADGMPILWAARLRRSPLPDRVAGSDLVWLLAERAARDGRSLFLLGGNPGAADAAARRFRERWPELRIAGIASPTLGSPPADAELEALRAELRAARPDLVYVALGVPKQDEVIAALRPQLPAAWWIGVGISLSFVAGEVRRAPPWMQRSGLEWAHRLAQEPRRLARRYLVEDLPFAFRLMADAWRARTSG
jgi:N-acetylglucosaminyldiphosphoundecaprenol N-acetyl-beta-D-mannosaminyltransferase